MKANCSTTRNMNISVIPARPMLMKTASIANNAKDVCRSSIIIANGLIIALDSKIMGSFKISFLV